VVPDLTTENYSFKYHQPSPGWERFREYPFYDWSDPNYQNFMIQMMEFLEVRQI